MYRPGWAGSLDSGLDVHKYAVSRPISISAKNAVEINPWSSISDIGRDASDSCLPRWVSDFAGSPRCLQNEKRVLRKYSKYISFNSLFRLLFGNINIVFEEKRNENWKIWKEEKWHAMEKKWNENYWNCSEEEKVKLTLMHCGQFRPRVWICIFPHLHNRWHVYRVNKLMFACISATFILAEILTSSYDSRKRSIRPSAEESISRIRYNSLAKCIDGYRRSSLDHHDHICRYTSDAVSSQSHAVSFQSCFSNFPVY